MNSAAGSRRKRRRKLPPGQRLLLYLGLAAVIVAIQGESMPAGVPLVEPGLATEDAKPRPPFELTHRLDDVEKALELQSCQTDLCAGIFAIEPGSGRYVSVNGEAPFSAASMIKLPVLVDLLLSMERKDLQSQQLLVIRPDLVGGGSGFLQWRPVGSKVSLKETLELMIIYSDNTATNMIIDALGGKDVLNRDFRQWGMQQTKIENLLPDLAGTNKTSPYDLSYLLGKVDQGELVSAENRKYMYKIMERTTIRTLLPPGLAPGSRIAHKTGDIGKMVGDAGIVTAPNGTRYFVAVQVQRPHNDHRANVLIRNISRIVYNGLVDDKLPPPDPPKPAATIKSSPAPAKHRRHHHYRRHA